MNWTFNEIPDQTGRVALVTGANSGLGFEVSRMLALKGAEVVMACRSHNKAQEAIGKICKEYPQAKLSVLTLDLADLDSVAQCAQHFLNNHYRLDLLINNAGVMVPPFSHTKQGFEMQFGTNHLGHFALTGRLLQLLIHTSGARVVSVSSLGSKIASIDFNDLNYKKKPYRAWFAYGQSKLAIQLFALELARRLESFNIDAKAVVAHPGGSSTNLQRTSGFFGNAIVKKILNPLITHKPADAALPSLRAACDPIVSNGSYWGPSGMTGLTGSPVTIKTDKRANNINVAKRLWDISEELSGVHYSFSPK